MALLQQAFLANEEGALEGRTARQRGRPVLPIAQTLGGSAPRQRGHLRLRGAGQLEGSILLRRVVQPGLPEARQLEGGDALRQRLLAAGQLEGHVPRLLQKS